MSQPQLASRSSAQLVWKMASENPVADIFYSEIDYADTAFTKPLSYGFPPLFGFCSVIVLNYVTRRPIMSGIQKHIAASAIGLGAGHWFYINRRKRHARRDAIYRHYILLHPEDFPEEKSKKFRDLLLPWHPVRPGN